MTTTSCGTVSWFVQVTVSPTLIVNVAGTNARPVIRTDLLDDAGAAAGAAGAEPMPMPSMLEAAGATAAGTALVAAWAVPTRAAKPSAATATATAPLPTRPRPRVGLVRYRATSSPSDRELTDMSLPPVWGINGRERP